MGLDRGVGSCRLEGCVDFGLSGIGFDDLDEDIEFLSDELHIERNSIFDNHLSHLLRRFLDLVLVSVACMTDVRSSLRIVQSAFPKASGSIAGTVFMNVFDTTTAVLLLRG